MKERVCIIGLDEPEYNSIKENLPFGTAMIAYQWIPRIMLKDGELLVESRQGKGFLPVDRVIFHGIYEDDFDFITALALWGGLCLPNALAMLDCRLKLPCLARALQHSHFGGKRSYIAPNMHFETNQQMVAKWGNWHCGENKTLFSEEFKSEHHTVIEPFFEGDAVRVVVIGEHSWQIRLEGKDWLKSIHDSSASLMEIDSELLEDTQNLKKAFNLEVIANDYIVSDTGSKHLLEVNHIPNVTRFPEIRKAYLNYINQWLSVPNSVVTIVS